MTVNQFVVARLRESDHLCRELGLPSVYLGPLWLWRILPARIVRPTATVFADHPDYDEAWRP